MTMPAFVAKGSQSNGNIDACTGIASLTPTFPATINASDILLLRINATSDATVDSVTIDASLGTWLAIYQNGLGTGRYNGLFYLVAAGTEDGFSVTVDIAMSGAPPSSSAICNVDCISGSGTGLVDTSSGGANSGTSTTPSFASLTTSLANQLAVGVLWANSNTTVGPVTGETGGDWTESAAEDSTVVKLIQLQTAGMPSAGTISGGTCTLGISTGWRTFSFALKEKDPPATVRPQPRTVLQAVNRASRW